MATLSICQVENENIALLLEEQSKQLSNQRKSVAYPLRWSMLQSLVPNMAALEFGRQLNLI